MSSGDLAAVEPHITILCVSKRFEGETDDDFRDCLKEDLKRLTDSKAGWKALAKKLEWDLRTERGTELVWNVSEFVFRDKEGAVLGVLTSMEPKVMIQAFKHFPDELELRMGSEHLTVDDMGMAA